MKRSLSWYLCGLTSVVLASVGCSSNRPVTQTVTTQVTPTDARLFPVQDSYYVVQRDARRCAAPMCGGFWVSLANHAQTTCADESQAESCYVATVEGPTTYRMGDVPIRGSNQYAVVVKGHFESDNPARLVATELWRAPVVGPVQGRYFLLRDTGIRCIQAPCSSIRQELLNEPNTESLPSIAFLNFDSVPMPIPAHNDATSAAAGNEGLIVAGSTANQRTNNTDFVTMRIELYFRRMNP